jgi:RNA polymerase sigma-70 factor (ECF subfamily)
MSGQDLDTDELVELAAAGDERSRDQLLARHRERLKRMVAIRMDRRLTARFYSSDVVQEAFIQASRELDDYLRRRDLPFYPCLRKIAWLRLMQLHRRHLQTQKRSVTREQWWAQQPPPDESMIQLAEELAASGTSPSQRALHDELLQRVKDAMDQLKPEDREILLLRHLEQLSVEETAAVLGMTPGNVRVRHARAVQQIHAILVDQRLWPRPNSGRA